MATKAEQLGEKFRRDAASAMAAASVVDYLRMMQEQSRIRRRHERMVDVRQKCQYPDYEPYDEETEGNMSGSIWYNNIICTDAESLETLVKEDDAQDKQPTTPTTPRAPQRSLLSRMLGPAMVAAGLATGGGLIGYGLTQLPTSEDTDTVTIVGIE